VLKIRGSQTMRIEFIVSQHIARPTERSELNGRLLMRGSIMLF
jgi:hypothetical protein